MIRNILLNFNIDTFAFVSTKKCKPANLRLYRSLENGKELFAIFMLFPYYCGETEGKISKYASVYDYHFFAKEVFSCLEEYFHEKYPDSFAKGFSDHSPYAECHGASLAGLGKIGKHSLLISEKYSSYVFIGEFITSLSKEELISEGIPEGAGEAEICEDCGLCSLACPAGCSGGKDRDTCISALTQKKAPLNEIEAALIKDAGSIWGCDACQDACPHTKKAIESGSIYTPIEFFKSSFLMGNICEKILKMDPDTFSRYPFAWRKREIIERNIALMGKEKDND